MWKKRNVSERSNGRKARAGGEEGSGTGTDSFERALSFLRRSGHFVRKVASIERVPIGVAGIDWLLGGGLPRGRIVEVFGFEHSGKTTMAAECAKAVQKLGLCVLYLDYEHALDFQYFKRIGLNLDNEWLWLYEQPFCLEEGIQIAIDLISTGQVGLLIVDSVASMCPREELEGAMKDIQIGLQARIMGKTLRKMVGLLQKHNTTGLFINQLRERIGQDARWYPTVTPGGRALKFHASVRIELKRIGKSTDFKAGSRHRALLRKQKTSLLQQGAVEFEVKQNGVDRIGHLRDCLLGAGVVENRSGTFFFEDKKLIRGQVEFENLLADVDKSAPLVRALQTAWAVKEEE